MHEILGALLTEAEVRLLCEERWQEIQRLLMERDALEAKLSKMDLALHKTMLANPECPLCRNGMEHSVKVNDWWKLNHHESCAWVEALAGDDEEEA